MKRSLMYLLLIFSSTMALAQDQGPHYKQAKYCLSFAKYQAGWWTDTKDVAKVTRSLGRVKWSGGTAIRFESPDKRYIITRTSKAANYAKSDTLFGKQ